MLFPSSLTVAAENCNFGPVCGRFVAAAGRRRQAAISVLSEGAGTREILLRDRPERLEVSRTFAHRFKAS